MASIYIREFMPAAKAAELVGKRIAFFVPWSLEQRQGTITRIGPSTIWLGAWCYHIDHIRRPMEVRS